MSDTWAVAFYGPGKIEANLVADLLDDWLPQTDDLKIFLPTKIGRSSIGLKTVRSWMEGVEQEYEETDTPLVEALVNAKADHTYLVLLWGEEGDKPSEELLLAAHEAKIPVKDLTKLLDDLIVEFPEPEPVVEPPKTRGRSRKPVNNPATPAELTKAKEEVLSKLEEDRTKVADQDEAQATDEVAVESQTVQASSAVTASIPLAGMFDGLNIEEAPPLSFGQKLENIIRDIVAEEIAKAMEPGQPGRPRKDGLPPGSGPSQYVPTDDEVTCTVIYDDDTEEYTLATRGRPKKGQVRIKMTRAEAKAKGVEFPPAEEDELPF